MPLPIKTAKQQEILLLIPQFRFLDRTHIQSLLHHKDEARINKWLTDLTRKEYIKRMYDNGIIGKNRRAAVFSLGQNGIKFLKTQGIYEKAFLYRLYRDKARSESFIDHNLQIAAICCELNNKNNNTLKYQYATESDFSRQDSPFYFLKSSAISADLVFSKKENGKKVKYFMLSLFDTTLPRYRVKKRIRDYKEFYFANDWENSMNVPFPIVFFVFQTKERMIYAKRYTKTLFEDDRPDGLSINFATADDVRTDGVTGAIWEEA